MTKIVNSYREHINNLLQRHRQLMQQNDLDYLLIPSGSPVGIYLDDMNYPFKSNFFFRTYCPLTEIHDSYLIIARSGKPCLVYYQAVDFWHKPASDPKGFWCEHFDIQVISEFQQACDYFPENNKRVALLGEPNRLTNQLTQIQQNPMDLINAIYWQRAYKSDYEIECIKQANQKAAYAHSVAEISFKENKSELQIHLNYLEATKNLEHQMPYSNIVALNHHASILHYTECDSRPPNEIKSFLLDAGATVNGYHSDITRSYSYQTDEFADLILAMNEMQQTCVRSIKNGQQYLDLHLSAHLQIATIINQFGFVDMSAEAIVENGVSAVFFPHGLGHLIGLQVHDVGGHFSDISGNNNLPPKQHAFLRTTRRMEQNMVFTIEPGFYFIDSLLAKAREGDHKTAFNWNKIENFMPYGGIRIEDNIVVQETGVLNLTRDAFAKL